MNYRSVAGCVGAAVLTLAGCSNDVGSDVNFSTGADATGGEETGGAASGDDDGGVPDTGGDGGVGGSGDGDTGSMGTDSGGDESTGGGIVEGSACNGVDVIFVVDNTSTMAGEQSRLIAVASSFVNNLNVAIPTATEGFHVGVLTTDDAQFKTTDREGASCGAFESGPWMELGSSFASELACTLNQGIGGQQSRPMDSLTGALSEAALGGGGVHEGFLRDGALLVVVIVTDKEDAPDPVTGAGSAGEPSEWAALVAEAKSFKQNVAVVSVVGHETPNACPPFQWDGTAGAQIADRIIDFSERFPTNEIGDVCALQYGSFFNSAVAPVAAACDNIAQ
jgi:hypothetical protein